jgi:outer membrane protein
MKLSYLLASTAAIAVFASASVGFADDAAIGLGTGDLLVRVRAVGVFPQVTGRDNNLNGSMAIGSSYIPEVDAAYYFNDHFAAEIIAGTTENNVKDKNANVVGTAQLGHVWLLPPTLTGQYHPLGRSAFDPYVGAGLNYTLFYGSGGAQNLLGQTTKVTYHNNFGEALQVGFNYEVSGPWFLNVDVKKIFLSTSAAVKLSSSGEVTSTNVRIDPWLIGVGGGYRF